MGSLSTQAVNETDSTYSLVAPGEETVCASVVRPAFDVVRRLAFTLVDAANQVASSCDGQEANCREQTVKNRYIIRLRRNESEWTMSKNRLGHGV